MQTLGGGGGYSSLYAISVYERFQADALLSDSGGNLNKDVYYMTVSNSKTWTHANIYHRALNFFFKYHIAAECNTLQQFTKIGAALRGLTQKTTQAIF